MHGTMYSHRVLIPDSCRQLAVDDNSPVEEGFPPLGCQQEKAFAVLVQGCQEGYLHEYSNRARHDARHSL